MIIAILISIFLTALIALTKSFRLGVSSISEFELQRRHQAGDKRAEHELKLRSLAPALEVAKSIKVTILTLAVVSTLVLCLPAWIGILASLVLLLVAQVVSAKGWLAGIAASIQKRYNVVLVNYIKNVHKFLGFMEQPVAAGDFTLNSVDELKQLINADQVVLQGSKKAQILAMLQFEQIKVSDVMVKRSDIVTVEANETVGPLLLDKLHKAGHNVFPVVSKGLDSVKGLLYMSDLVPLDPDIKDVKDAMRPSAYSLQQDASLGDVLAASVKTGRQLFFVSKGEKIVGLITLADVLGRMTGQKIAKEVEVDKI